MEGQNLDKVCQQEDEEIIETIPGFAIVQFAQWWNCKNKNKKIDNTAIKNNCLVIKLGR